MVEKSRKNIFIQHLNYKIVFGYYQYHIYKWSLHFNSNIKSQQYFFLVKQSRKSINTPQSAFYLYNIWMCITVNYNIKENFVISIPTLIAMQSENGKNKTTKRKDRNIRQYPQQPMSPSRSTSVINSDK